MRHLHSSWYWCLHYLWFVLLGLDMCTEHKSTHSDFFSSFFLYYLNLADENGRSIEGNIAWEKKIYKRDLFLVYFFMCMLDKKVRQKIWSDKNSLCIFCVFLSLFILFFCVYTIGRFKVEFFVVVVWWFGFCYQKTLMVLYYRRVFDY